MSASHYKKTLRTTNKVGTKAATAAAGEMAFSCPKDYLTAEYQLSVKVAQGFATTVPTSSDVRDFIKDISLTLSGGKHSGKVFTLDGAQAYDLGRFTENAPLSEVTLAATSTAEFGLDLHMEADESLRDLDTAIRTGDYSEITVAINFNADNANGFKGGVIGAGAAAVYTVELDAIKYPHMTPVSDLEKANAPQGSKYQRIESFSNPAVAIGSNPDIDLKPGAKTRFLLIHTRNAGGTLADGILGAVSMKPGGFDVVDIGDAKAIRRANVSKRGFNAPGVYIVDFGDDPDGFLDLSEVKQAKLTYTALAAGSLKVTQVNILD